MGCLWIWANNGFFRHNCSKNYLKKPFFHFKVTVLEWSVSGVVNFAVGDGEVVRGVVEYGGRVGIQYGKCQINRFTRQFAGNGRSVSVSRVVAFQFEFDVHVGIGQVAGDNINVAVIVVDGEGVLWREGDSVLEKRERQSRSGVIRSVGTDGEEHFVVHLEVAGRDREFDSERLSWGEAQFGESGVGHGAVSAGEGRKLNVWHAGRHIDDDFVGAEGDGWVGGGDGGRGQKNWGDEVSHFWLVVLLDLFKV